MQNKIQSEDAIPYQTEKAINEDHVIEEALEILAARLTHNEISVCSPKDAIDYLKLQLSELEHEVFAVLFLDNRHRLIKYCEMFRGTINGASVYPREVAKEALNYNAAAVIFAHNHPSGNPDPSESDRQLTKRLSDALELLDIRVLDHLVIGCDGFASFAERGLL